MNFKIKDCKNIPSYIMTWEPSLVALAEKNSLQFLIDVSYVCALIQTESSGRVNAVRYEKDFPWIKDVMTIAKAWKLSIETTTILLKSSWGCTQVMGMYAVELGLPKYNLLPHDLCIASNGVHFGCLAWNDKKVKNKITNPLDIYAAYNAGSVRLTSNGLYVNASNVDHFEKNLRMFN